MALPKPPVDVPMDRDLAKLAPGFALRVRAVLDTLTAKGYDPIVVEAFRTDARQKFLYGFGRLYDDGRGKVTNARDASLSMHGYGLAVDIVSKSKLWNAGPAWWEALAKAAEAHGCDAGLRWKMRDSPHIQFGRALPTSPTKDMIAMRAEKNLAGIWTQYGANA